MLPKRIAIVAVDQIGHEEVKDNNLRDVCYESMKGLLNKINIKRDDLGSIVSASSDYWQGISCSNSVYYDAVGAYLKNSSKVEEDGASAFMYGMLRVLSGHFDTVAIHAITKSSEVPDHKVLTSMYGDPFFTRPFGLDDISAAALQANLYMTRYGISEEQIAKIAVKNLRNALNNPYSHRSGNYTIEDIVTSAMAAYPIRSLDCPPQSDGVCSVLLASAEKARELTDNPVWVKGLCWGTDHSFIGDRDLLNTELANVAQKAYEMAGITNPKNEIQVAEICSPYSFQELMYCEQLGFCNEGDGGRLSENGTIEMTGELPVNPSGGVTATNPYVARGLIRVVEAALQVMGSAESRQVPNVTNALAHSAHGFGGQLHSVIILGK